MLITVAEKADALATMRGVSGPVAVEMETAAAARIAAAAGIPWAAVRAISDSAGESLPLDFNTLRAPDGDLPVSRVALAALLRPSCVPGLLRLAKGTQVGAEALANCLSTALHLPTEV